MLGWNGISTDYRVNVEKRSVQLTAPDDRVENDKLGAAEEELVSKAEAAAADVGASIGKVGAASAVENTSGHQGEGLTKQQHYQPKNKTKNKKFKISAVFCPRMITQLDAYTTFYRYKYKLSEKKTIAQGTFCQNNKLSAPVTESFLPVKLMKEKEY
uniref:Uncharacterized protein n=1 Tax=Oryza glumipatula TaxID=40148 RepID=A0A0D9ZQC3_9ORYZ